MSGLPNGLRKLIVRLDKRCYAQSRARQTARRTKSPKALDHAVKQLVAKAIAAELVTQVRKSITIDWTVRESARAKIKDMVKRILRKHGYPPDLQEEATKTVLAPAELLCADWAV